MANLGNAWHIPLNAEPRGRGGMRDPAGPLVPGAPVNILSGNQFQGDGNPGNQLQTGSSLLWRTAGGAGWNEVPMMFDRAVANNKYYAATIPPGSAKPGDAVEYYLRIAYDDHDTTYLYAGGAGSTATADQALAQATPFRFDVDSSADRGLWGPVIDLPNVPIHAHVLPDGRVLMWGRRDGLGSSMDQPATRPFVWDPTTGQVTNTPQPTRPDGATVNLFCSGHSFLPDGRLFVAGGHLRDSDGLSQATAYDATTNQWTALPPMTAPGGQEVRRWYPTCTTLPDGSVLVLSGSYISGAPPNENTIIVDLLQVWDGVGWATIPSDAAGTPLNYVGLPLYPRMHVIDDEHAFMSGTMDRTQLLKITAPGEWTTVDKRALGNRDYCPAVTVAADRILYIGGGGGDGGAPTDEVELIDLSAAHPGWVRGEPMAFPRRQHNATVLPDGSVLVTGGTRGPGFNNVDQGQPVHVAELWNPTNGTWQQMAAETVDRCYHSTALLLPDGRVFSGGGGEFQLPGPVPNDPEDTHTSAQLFSPPYMFRGSKPTVAAAPTTISYGGTFVVDTPQAPTISKVSLVRLPSVTHSFDENQRIVFLTVAPDADRVIVSAPDSPGSCPPGHYMLFLLTDDGVPSEARIVQVASPVVVADPAIVASSNTESEPQPVTPEAVGSRSRWASDDAVGYRTDATYLSSLESYEVDVAAMQRGMVVVVGVRGTCPYGIGACWGGAHEALGRLEGVALVRPIPNDQDSTAEVFLGAAGLPPLPTWFEQFERILNGTYILRGVEVTLAGTVETIDGELVLEAVDGRPSVRLLRLGPSDKLQWDRTTQAPKRLEPDEADAYDRLAARQVDGNGTVEITGPLTQTASGYELNVRRVNVP